MAMALPLKAVFYLFLVLLIQSSINFENVNAKNKPNFKPGPWEKAHATFYGGKDGSGTIGGACGYENPMEKGYGLQTAAISKAMFNDGLTCGACYEIKCAEDKLCKSGHAPLIITATNLCPEAQWTKEHFDLTQTSFLQIAEEKAGHVPVDYRRVPCPKKGGMKFTITGNPNWNQVLVWNVAGAGDVTSVQVKGSKNVKWTPMKRSWGQKWETSAKLAGESLTFRVTSSDGKTSTSWHVAPPTWQFGQTFEGKNFK